MTLTLLALIAPIGALDVVYYHLYRFRLYEQEKSVAEEVTHLIRQLCFLAVVALLASGVGDAFTDRLVLCLLVIDVVNSGADVLLEPRSRAALGGLPPGEYFLHFLGTTGTTLAAASYIYERASLPIAPAQGLLAWQSGAMLVGGTGLFVLEAALFVRARWRARRLALAVAG